MYFATIVLGHTVKSPAGFPGVKRFGLALSGSGWRQAVRVGNFAGYLARLFHLANLIWVC